jgi:hypothetical protein
LIGFQVWVVENDARTIPVLLMPLHRAQLCPYDGPPGQRHGYPSTHPLPSTHRRGVPLSHPLIFAAETKAPSSHSAPQRPSFTHEAALHSTIGLFLASK